MKRIQSVLTIFFALFVALAAFSFRAEAAGAVFDNAKVLSTAEVQKLNEEVDNTNKTLNEALDNNKKLESAYEAAK